MNKQNEPIEWKQLTREQRNTVVAEKVMNTRRVADKSLLPDTKKKIPNYTANLNEACLILLTFTGTELLYKTDTDLARIYVKIDDEEVFWTDGAGEECAEAICIAALRAVGLEVNL